MFDKNIQTNFFVPQLTVYFLFSASQKEAEQ